MLRTKVPRCSLASRHISIYNGLSFPGNVFCVNTSPVHCGSSEQLTTAPPSFRFSVPCSPEASVPPLYSAPSRTSREPLLSPTTSISEVIPPLPSSSTTPRPACCWSREQRTGRASSKYIYCSLNCESGDLVFYTEEYL